MRIPLKTTTNLSFVISLGLLSVIVFFSYYRIRKVASDNDWVIHTHQAWNSCRTAPST